MDDKQLSTDPKGIELIIGVRPVYSDLLHTREAGALLHGVYKGLERLPRPLRFKPN